MRCLAALAALVFVAAPVAAQSSAPAASGPAAPSGQTASGDAIEMPEVIGGLASLVGGIAYPAEAQAAQAEGRVIVRFVVDETGEVEEAEVFRPVHPALDEAALEAVEQARFRPATRDGAPVRVRMAVPITFDLPGGAAAL